MIKKGGSELDLRKNLKHRSLSLEDRVASIILF